MSSLVPTLQALGRPVAVCLVLGVIQFLQDYQQTGKLSPSLVDGGLVAAKAAAAWLAVNTAAVQVQSAQARAAAAKAPAAAS